MAGYLGDLTHGLLGGLCFRRGFWRGIVGTIPFQANHQ